MMRPETSDDSDEIRDIRLAVTPLYGQFPGTYSRKLDRESAYPTEFVTALIPEAYGGAEENSEIRGQWCGLSRADVYHGQPVAAWVGRAKGPLSAADRLWWLMRVRG